MYELMIKGTQSFMGKEIPVVSGGFGIGKRCMTDKTIAEIHDMKVMHVRELINRSLKRFQDGVDFIDLKVIVQDDNNLLLNLGYSKMQISKAEHIYLLSERGYAKLIKIMDTDLAWEIHDKLIDEYFELKEDSINRQQLSPQKQLMNMLVESMSKNELEQKRQAEKLEQLDDKKLIEGYIAIVKEMAVKYGCQVS